jgi:two-component system response regulator FixJ
MNEEPTIFVVDDDPQVLASVTRSLTKRGYKVEGYSSGKTFLDAFSTGRPGCIVLDFGLPGMSGLDVQAKLIEDKIPAQIIFVTGHGGIPESVQATKAGSVDFLEKPYQPEILRDRVEEALALDRKEHEKKIEHEEVRLALASLTEREREVFELMVDKPELSSSKGVALELDISPRTVDKHRAQILLKTGSRTVPELIGRYGSAVRSTA